MIVGALLAAMASPAAAQVLSIDQVQRIIQAVHDGERMRWGASSTRQQRNEDWAQVIGVVHFGHPTYNPTPDSSWCIKDAGGGRPQSDDVVVQCATRFFWDCVPSAGADTYSIECRGHGAERLSSEQNVYPPPRPTRIGGGTAPPVDPTGAWTAAHADILRRLGSSDTKRIAEQLRASFPSQEWGQKRVDTARPISGDVVAVRANGRLTGVRVVPAATAGVIGDISGQVFVAVSAVDHLGAGVVTPNPTPGPTPSPTPTPSPNAVNLQPVLDAIAVLAAKVDALAARASAVVDLSDLTARLDAVSVQVDQARQEIGALASKPIVVDWPEYSGVLLGQRVTLRPRR